MTIEPRETTAEQLSAKQRALIEKEIARIEGRMGAQINAILHHPDFQTLESAWRSLEYVINNVLFREGIRVTQLNISKAELLEDFEDSPEVVKSGLYWHVYWQFRHQFSLMIGLYEIGPGDIELLEGVADVAAQSQTPFLASVAPSMFGVADLNELVERSDLKDRLDTPQHAAWHGFRERESSRYVGLVAPRFLLRLPYGASADPVEAFPFEEDVIDQPESYLWGPTTLTLAARVAASFARYRWCANIIGDGGEVEHMPLHRYELAGETKTRCPLDVQLSPALERELSEHGFIGLRYRGVSDNIAVFSSANSCQRPMRFGDSPEEQRAERSYALGAQLPYLSIVARLMQYLKVLQHEQIGSWREREDLERQLDEWLQDYVLGDEDPESCDPSRKLFREGRLSLEESESPGWWRCVVEVMPRFESEGQSFTLRVVGKIDRS